MSKIMIEKTISLGFFCSPSIWLKGLGLRNRSYPFDWVISSNMALNNDLIENGFIDFLDEKLLISGQMDDKYLRIQNTKYKIQNTKFIFFMIS